MIIGLKPSVWFLYGYYVDHAVKCNKAWPIEVVETIYSFPNYRFPWLKKKTNTKTKKPPISSKKQENMAL